MELKLRNCLLWQCSEAAARGRDKHSDRTTTKAASRLVSWKAWLARIMAERLGLMAGMAGDRSNLVGLAPHYLLGQKRPLGLCITMGAQFFWTCRCDGVPIAEWHEVVHF